MGSGIRTSDGSFHKNLENCHKYPLYIARNLRFHTEQKFYRYLRKTEFNVKWPFTVIQGSILGSVERRRGTKYYL